MRFDPGAPLVRHEVGDGFAVAADDKRLAGILHCGEQAGEMGFRLVNIHSFHCDYVSPLSPSRQGQREQF